MYQDELAYAFADINRRRRCTSSSFRASTLVRSPRRVKDNRALLGHLLWASGGNCRQKGLAKGYRIVVNTGEEGGQTVDHLHLHLMGGRQMTWPPG